MKWTKINKSLLPEPTELPEIDEFVLWRTEEGNYFVSEIDKDDTDWWNGTPTGNGTDCRPACTHWAKITAPDESESSIEDQDTLWKEVQKIIEMSSMHAYLPSPIIEMIKTRFILTRKP